MELVLGLTPLLSPHFPFSKNMLRDDRILFNKVQSGQVLRMLGSTNGVYILNTLLTFSTKDMQSPLSFLVQTF